MKLISWNVNGLRAIVKKGFVDEIARISPDVVCLQETRLSEGQLDLNIDDYTSYWNYADKRGYSGTAVYTRIAPVSHTTGMDRDAHDHEGRVITIEYPDFYVVNVYTPNSRTGLVRLDYRMEWEDAFLEYVTGLDRSKPVVICGDLNVAHNDIDLANPKSNRRNPGFTDDERNALTRLLEAGFVDTFRHLHPDRVAYSWWSNRFNSRAKNIGWRIDYFLVSQRLVDRLTEADILDDVFGSDHCPVTITIADKPPVEK